MIKIEQTKNGVGVEVTGSTIEIGLDIDFLVRALEENDKEAMDCIVLSLSHHYTKERFLELVDSAYITKEVVEKNTGKIIDKLISKLIDELAEEDKE